MPRTVQIVDEDEANLFLMETLSQISFLLDAGDLNATGAFDLFFRLPVAKMLLVGDLENHIPVSLHFSISHMSQSNNFLIF